MKHIIEIKKNCDNCIKQDTCKFLSQYKKLVRSNEFYEMFEYLEWNNLELIFKSNASAYKCYKQSFPNGELNKELHPDYVWQRVFKLYLNNKWKKYSSNSKTKTYDIIDENGNPVTMEMMIELYDIKIVAAK